VLLLVAVVAFVMVVLPSILLLFAVQAGAS
jgi:hypothetical protein